MIILTTDHHQDQEEGAAQVAVADHHKHHHEIITVVSHNLSDTTDMTDVMIEITTIDVIGVEEVVDMVAVEEVIADRHHVDANPQIGLGFTSIRTRRNEHG